MKPPHFFKPWPHWRLKSTINYLMSLLNGLPLCFSSTTPQPVSSLALYRGNISFPCCNITLAECGAFLLKCSLVFKQQPSILVLYFGWILDSLTIKAAHSFSPVCNSYPLFATEMIKTFDQTFQSKETGQKFLCLSQGNSSIAEYAVEIYIFGCYEWLEWHHLACYVFFADCLTQLRTTVSRL